MRLSPKKGICFELKEAGGSSMFSLSRCIRPYRKAIQKQSEYKEVTIPPTWARELRESCGYGRLLCGSGSIRTYS